jgi:hypothetical protein
MYLGGWLWWKPGVQCSAAPRTGPRTNAKSICYARKSARSFRRDQELGSFESGQCSSTAQRGMEHHLVH